MTPDSAIATAADYADAMITARRAKNILLLIILLLLLGQIAIFFAVRYTSVMETMSSTTTQPTRNWGDLLNFVTNGAMFVSIAATIVLCFVLLLIVNIMLVGRLIGVARVTSAYIWTLVLLVLLFPWQFFLSNVGLTMDRINWKIPGVLWTWGELARDARFSPDITSQNMLHWVCFVVMPLVAVLIVLAIRIKSTRGIRQALGEDDTIRGDTGV